MVDWSLSVATALYIGGLMQFFAPLRDRPDGAYWVIAAVGLNFACDSAAFFAGRAFGRTPLAPVISPKKSLEGAVAGLVVTTLVGGVFGFATGRSPFLLGGLGLSVAAAAIVGDLAESMLKRQTGVKDSGGLVPGHGGLLDRMDSLLFCGPVAVLFLKVFT
jgi:phosphatidate cytidylyltransferase